MCIIKCLVVFYLFQNFYTEVVILYKVWNKFKKKSHKLQCSSFLCYTWMVIFSQQLNKRKIKLKRMNFNLRVLQVELLLCLNLSAD